MGTLANIQVEPCSVEWDGSDLGFTDGDIEITTEEQGVEITAHQEGTNVLDMIRTGKSCEIGLTLKETTLAKIQAILAAGGGESSETAQVATITTVADSSGSLNNKLFFIVGKNPTTKALVKYVVWLNVNSAGTDPSIPGWTSVPVAVATGDSANTVADLVAAALDALAEFSAPNPGADVITVTWSEGGAIAIGDDADGLDAGNSGFTCAVTTPGASDLAGWGKDKDFTGMLGDSAQLILHPVVRASADKTCDFNAWKAYPMMDSIVQSGENPKTISVTFKVFPDTSKADGIRLFAVGDGS